MYLHVYIHIHTHILIDCFHILGAGGCGIAGNESMGLVWRWRAVNAAPNVGVGGTVLR